MRLNYLFTLAFCCFFSLAVNAQTNETTPANYHGIVSNVEYVSPMADRPDDLLFASTEKKEAKDKRSLAYESMIIEMTRQLRTPENQPSGG